MRQRSARPDLLVAWTRCDAVTPRNGRMAREGFAGLWGCALLVAAFCSPAAVRSRIRPATSRNPRNTRNPQPTLVAETARRLEPQACLWPLTMCERATNVRDGVGRRSRVIYRRARRKRHSFRLQDSDLAAVRL